MHRLLCTFPFGVAVAASALSLRSDGDLSPLLTTIKNTPDLSIFYSLINSTGAPSGIPGPALEERFNDPNNRLQFTAFAPTNAAFANVSQEALARLQAPMSYQLLYSLLINHIAPGNLTFTDLQKEGNVHAIGGFDINFDAQGALVTNANTSSEPDRLSYAQATLIKDPSGQPVRIPASNGAIFPIDHVLDGLFTYFGVDSPVDTLPSEGKQQGTMLDILRTNPDLSTLYQAWQNLDPNFLQRLSLLSANDAVNNKTIYLAPSNKAFDHFPPGAMTKLLQPSNYDLSTYLLSFGLGALGEGRVLSDKGFEIVVEGGRASNAEIQTRICAENGCVGILGRWLDPLWGLF